ncbi:MAG: sugar phosphate nucleotidyltransferase [Candidatus Methanoperedens sp.]|jgi:NDP-sugar pyrophosphorylase family protein|nr:sugar phosphate nucleotidyltransferase [Candidatus Methanoperedens sp.]PKL53875.1 MAG: galactokinase [Candidatus Methanoperedenaceae archaeon HGW-Methanoperedenaceae-1]
MVREMVTNLKDIDVIILCGGLGTRLRPAISDRPKALAKIDDKTFLDILIDDVLKHGFKNIILCVGYLKERIKDHFNYEKDYNIDFSEEDYPLGTGGALNNAKSLIKSDTFMVMNGDSICNVDFKDFFDFHIYRKATLSMVLTRSHDGEDYGNVVLDDSQNIICFKEKVDNKGQCLINAGVYMMQKEIFSYMPDETIFSLEYDLFPKLINNKCYGYIIENELLDIGTPERYKKAINIIGGKQ